MAVTHSILSFDFLPLGFLSKLVPFFRLKSLNDDTFEISNDRNENLELNGNVLKRPKRLSFVDKISIDFLLQEYRLK